MPSIISDYISKNMSILDLKKELSRLRAEYNKETGRNLFIYAADFNKARQGIDVSLMQDDFHYDDEAIAAALNVKRTSVRSMRSKTKERER